MKTTLIILLVLALGGVGYAVTKKDAAPAPVDETPTEDERVRGPEDKAISVGNPTEISGLTVTALTVTDSRCPTDVQCVWAGEVAVGVTLAHGDEVDAAVMKLNAPVEFAGYSISLTAALPYPQSAGKIDQDDYMLTFHVAPVIESSENI